MKPYGIIAALLLFGAACSSDETLGPLVEDAGRTADAGSPDVSEPEVDAGLPEDAGEVALDMGTLEDMGLAVDMGADAGVEVDAGPTDAGAPNVIRGRLESAGPVRSCGQLVNWAGPDGFLLRPQMNVCGDDMSALAATITDNLDAAQARNGQVMLVIGQGLNLPTSWLAGCETFSLNSGPFVGTSCVPWDASYQASLRAALVDVIGPAVRGHPALSGVYFTTTTMTNGSEMHFRADRDVFANYPGDASFSAAYQAVMDIYQAAFDVPIVFEAGHCPFQTSPDCDVPMDLYTHSVTTYGPSQVGVAMWNCAERFFVSAQSPEYEARPLLERAAADGVSVGCQTVGAFEQACRFSSSETRDYGGNPMGGGPNACPGSTTSDMEAACVDTMDWLAGTARQNPASLVPGGTWLELWSRDLAEGGIYTTSSTCRAAVDRFAAP